VSRRLLALLMLLLGGLAGQSATAQPQQDPLRTRAEALVGLFNGTTEPEALFSAAFLSAVPAAQVKAISAQLRTQLGAAEALNRVEPSGAHAGTVHLDFERGTLQLNLAVEPKPPHLIQGLLVVGSEVKGDSFARLIQELKALPGQVSLAVARLGKGSPELLAAHEGTRPMAVGSAFKLFLLAELDRSIRAGERKWSDAVPLTHRSLPSGFLQDWPAGSPVTLHSLAALMVSQSDNSATDTLLHALGRGKVESILPVVGVKAPGRNRPFLATMEAFVLKGGDPELARAWVASGEAERRALLGRIGAVPADRVDAARLAAQPNLIDSVEWFVSAEDLVRTMDWLRQNGRKETLDILAINPGLARPAAERFGYVGYKGGSETGVVAMSYLIRTHEGAWYSVAGSWNNPAAKVEEDRFALLLSRAISLLPR
jgi:beta-lactamase class A